MEDVRKFVVHVHSSHCKFVVLQNSWCTGPAWWQPDYCTEYCAKTHHDMPFTPRRLWESWGPSLSQSPRPPIQPSQTVMMSEPGTIFSHSNSLNCAFWNFHCILAVERRSAPENHAFSKCPCSTVTPIKTLPISFLQEWQRCRIYVSWCLFVCSRRNCRVCSPLLTVTSETANREIVNCACKQFCGYLSQKLTCCWACYEHVETHRIARIEFPH